MQFFSPAKINLFFRVLGKREDGFHEVASLMQAVDLGDTLTFTRGKEDSLTCDQFQLSLKDDNLILRAARLYRKMSGQDLFVRVHLTKRTPWEAGLGGGSSNAATTLWAMNQLSKNPVSLDHLRSWGAELGSDVPFFFSHGTALCKGRGEKIFERKVSKSASSLWLIKPQRGLSTPRVFQKISLSRCSSLDPESLLSSWQSDSPLRINDLEEPAFSLDPTLINFKENLLDRGFDFVAMTGSGTCFLCWGHPNLSSLRDCFIQEVRFLNRENKNWYIIK